MPRSRVTSLVETVAILALRLFVALATQAVVFLILGLQASPGQNLTELESGRNRRRPEVARSVPVE
jgi:hypothetical protein